MVINYIDILLVILFAASIAAGYAKGFVLSLISFAKYIIGFPLAFYVADTYSSDVYERFVQSQVLERVSEGLSTAADIDSFVASVREAVNSLPFGLSHVIDLSFLDGLNADSAAGAVTDNIVEPVAMVAVKILLFVLTVAAFYVITWIVARIIRKLDNVKHMPLKKTNKFLGAVFGALQGVASLAVISALLVFARDFLLEPANGFSQQIASSAVVAFINKLNPLLFLI